MSWRGRLLSQGRGKMSFYRWIKLQRLKTFPPDICLAWLAHRRHWSRAVVTSLQLITFEIEFWLSCSNRCHSQICFPLPPRLTLQPLLKRNSKASLARRVAPSINATRVCKTSQVTLFRCQNAHVHVHAVMLYRDPHNVRFIHLRVEVSWGTKSSMNSWGNL